MNHLHFAYVFSEILNIDTSLQNFQYYEGIAAFEENLYYTLLLEA